MAVRDGVYRKVVQAITEYKMIAPGERVIVGVSGGADSVCLLDVLRSYQQELPFSIMVVHVEHGIRGQESLEDARFVEQLCESWKIPCQVERVDVTALAKEEGLSVEEAGRKARYGIFQRWCAEWNADKIAVAHNQNDQAETVLLNLSRGSGLRGMGGIYPVRDNIIRPLLFLSRAEIEDRIRKRNLSYRTDGTNLKTDYTRNKLRLQILPELEQGINREAGKHIAEAALRVQKVENYLLRQAGELQESCVSIADGRIEIFLPKFNAAEEVLQEYVLRRCIRELMRQQGLKDYTAGHIEDLKRLALMPCGKRMDLPGIEAVRQREVMLLEKISGTEGNTRTLRMEKIETDICALPDDGDYEYHGARFHVEYLRKTENIKGFPEKKFTKWLAYDTISKDVCLRTRKTGDYLIVNREGGKKKLKDYLIDRKIPREVRDSILLVAQGSHILRVVGEGISEAAKVTETTGNLLKIQMMEEKV